MDCGVCVCEREKKETKKRKRGVLFHARNSAGVPVDDERHAPCKEVLVLGGTGEVRHLQPEGMATLEL